MFIEQQAQIFSKMCTYKPGIYCLASWCIVLNRYWTKNNIVNRGGATRLADCTTWGLADCATRRRSHRSLVQSIQVGGRSAVRKNVRVKNRIHLCPNIHQTH